MPGRRWWCAPRENWQTELYMAMSMWSPGEGVSFAPYIVADFYFGNYLHFDFSLGLLCMHSEEFTTASYLVRLQGTEGLVEVQDTGKRQIRLPDSLFMFHL
tara:strand:- start:928 stop:1230 length:303 start_codon:yes stop_codon:yes gene_type:complete